MLFRGLLSLLNMTGVPRLLFRLMLDRRVPLRVKLILPLAVAYLVWPFDVVWDILPAFGRIDDVLVVLLGVGLFLVLAPKEVVAEHIKGRGTAPSDAGEVDRPDGKVIEAEYRIEDDVEDEAKDGDGDRPK